MRHVLRACARSAGGIGRGFVVLAALAGMTAAAEAKCQRLEFLVNDYGKDGPMRDARALLDKEIVKWAANNKVKTYTTERRDMKCEKFLDFGFFDEYTCTASADVCPSGGSGPAPAKPQSKPAAAKAVDKKAVDKPVDKPKT